MSDSHLDFGGGSSPALGWSQAQLGVIDGATSSEDVTGFFDTPDDAEEIIEQLYGLGITAQQISTERRESTSGSAAPSLSAVAGPAAAGAAIGGLIGALLGWAIAVGAVVLPGVTTEALPGVGTTVGSAVAAAMLTALLLGAGIGALIAALIASGARPGMVERHSGVLLVVHVPTELAARTADILRANGAARAGSASEPVPAPVSIPASLFTSSEKENNTMSEDQTGRDPNSLTGTKGAFDPETGVYGTAGTPLTTGYGVSGSTAGIGSASGEDEHKEDDFRGSTPDSTAYNTGGRSATDDIGNKLGADTGPSVADKYSDSDRQDEASIPIEPEEQDIYEQKPGYGESLNRTPGIGSTSGGIEAADAAQSATGSPVGSGTNMTMPASSGAPQYYSSTSAEEGPTYGKVDTESTQASAGTNIPGTSDVRGLGDNTDTD